MKIKMTMVMLGLAALMSACGDAGSGAVEELVGEPPIKSDPPVTQVSDVEIPETFFPNINRDGQEYQVALAHEGARVSYFHRDYDGSYSLSVASILETAVMSSELTEHNFFHAGLMQVRMFKLEVGKMDISQWEWWFALPSFASQFTPGFSGEVEIREIHYVPMTEAEKRISASDSSCLTRVAGYISGTMSVQGTVPHTYYCQLILGKMGTAEIKVDGRFLLPILEPRGSCIVE